MFLLNNFTLEIKDLQAQKAFDEFRHEQFRLMLKPTFFGLVVCFIVQVIGYIADSES